MHMSAKKPDKMGRVRTTVTLDPDAAKILERLQKERGQGLSEVVNDALRSAGAGQPARKPFVQTTSDMGVPKIPLDNIAEVLELLDEDLPLDKWRG